MIRSALCFSLVFLLVITLSSSAAADTSPTKEELLETDFQTLIGMAQEAFLADNYEAAVEYLVMANRRDPNSRLLINIARSHVRAGDCRTGLAYYDAFLRHPTADEELLDGVRESIAEGAADCPAYHDGLGGRLLFESEPQLATVYLDDELVGITPTETAGLEPGTYTVRLELEGYDDFVQEIEIVGGEDLNLGAMMEEESDEPVEPVVTEPVTPSGDGPELNYIALGLAGAGLAGVATGLVFDLVLIPQIDEDRGLLNATTDAQEIADLTAQRKTYATVALASYIGGGLLMAGGIAWFVYDYVMADTDEPTSRYGWQVAPDVNRDGASLIFLRRF